MNSKALIILSFVISILGALQPFFIMSVYNFALTSSSQATLYWLTLFAIIVGFGILLKRCESTSLLPLK